MPRHRKVSAKRRKGAQGMAVIAFLGLTLAAPAVAAAETGDGGTGPAGADAAQSGSGTDSATSGTTAGSTSTGQSSDPTVGDSSGGNGQDDPAPGPGGGGGDTSPTSTSTTTGGDDGPQTTLSSSGGAQTSTSGGDAAGDSSGAGEGGGSAGAEEQQQGTDASGQDATGETTPPSGDSVPPTETPSPQPTETASPQPTQQPAGQPAAGSGGDSGAPTVEEATVEQTAAPLSARTALLATDAGGPDPQQSDPPTQAPMMFAAATTAPAATAAKSPLDFLPDYPDVPGYTKTEVAAAFFLAFAAATVTALTTVPLAAIPLGLMTVSAFVRLTDLGTNHAPVAAPVQTGQLLGVVTGDLNATDPDGDPLLYSVTTKPLDGSVVVLPDGHYVYTASDLLGRDGGTDSFTVTIDDSLGVRDHPFGDHTTTVAVPVSLTGSGINTGPSFTTKAIVTNIDPDTGVVTGIFAATDPEGDPLTYSGFALLGSVAVGDGTFTYTPTDAARHAAASVLAGTINTTDVVTITANDGNGGIAVSPVTVDIPGVNAVPTATAQQDSTEALTGLILGKIVVDDPDGDIPVFTPVAFTTDQGGVVAVVPGTGDFTYLPTAELRHQAALDPTGTTTDSFTVTVDDLHGGTVDVPVVVTIQGHNSAPIIVPVSTGIPDSAGVVRSGILASDPDGDPLSYTLANGEESIVTAKGGIVQVDGADYTYIPSTTGGDPLLGTITDSFKITVSDGYNGATTVTVGILTSELDFGYTASLDDATHTVSGGLSAPSDDLGLFSYSVGSGPSHGTVDIDSTTGAYTYTGTDTPQADSFTIVGTDAYGHAVTLAALSVSTVPPNHDPSVSLLGGGVGDSAGIVRGTVNASDPDGDPLSFSVTGYDGDASAVRSNGSVVQVDDQGRWTYIPSLDGGTLGLIGDTFTVYVSDGRGGQASTPVVIATKELDLGYSANAAVGSVAGALSIPGGDVGLLSYSLGSPPGSGSVTVASDGSYSYTGGDPATFSIVGTNAYGKSLTVANVSVTPVAPNRAPTLDSSGTGITPLKGKTDIWTLVTVKDADGDSVTWVGTASNGSVNFSVPIDLVGLDGVMTSSRTVTYKSNGGSDSIFGLKDGPSDTIVITVTDSEGASLQFSLHYPQ